MKTPLKFLGLAGGVAGACAVCCAIPLALPLLAAAGFGGGLGLAAFGWETALGLVVAAGAATMLVLRRRAAAPACSTAGACGCATKTLPRAE